MYCCLLWAGDIPASTKFRVRLCCSAAHPGLCRTADHCIFNRTVKAGKLLLKYCLDNNCEHEYLQLGTAEADLSLRPDYVAAYCAHIRLRDPKMALFVLLTCQDGFLQPALEFGKAVPLTHQSLLKRVHGVGTIDAAVASLRVRLMTTDPRPKCPIGYRTIKSFAD